MPNIANTYPIDARSAEYEPLLRKLQGNILKGHGRRFTANIFLQFHVRGAALEEVLRSLTERFVTSACEQQQQRDQYRHRRAQPENDEPPRDAMFGNLFLTRHAYEHLGHGDQLETWFPDPPDDAPNPPRKARFRTGMLAAAGDLGDELTASTAVEPLEVAYAEDRIDALLLLAENSEFHLVGTAERLMDELASSGVASAVAIEFGRVRCNDQRQGVEHFGYADGISQPLFFSSDFETLQASEGIDRWDPFAALSLVLLRDPGVPGDEDAFGSYFVFRKLEQNVRAFHAAEAALASALDLEPADASRAGAMIIGRFRDGTPLALSGAGGLAPAGANNFRYDGLLATLTPGSPDSGDRLGLKCPFQSHIRKTNPRQSQHATSSTRVDIEKQDREDRDRRIVRRGITYGVRADADLPEGGVGILFGCFQRSIMRQYAFIQRNWANMSTFKIPGGAPGEKTGLDPVIGQPSSREKPAQHWRAEYGGALDEPEFLNELPLALSHPTARAVGGFVRFRGGEFFFAPSLPFLLGSASRAGRATPADSAGG